MPILIPEQRGSIREFQILESTKIPSLDSYRTSNNNVTFQYISFKYYAY